MLISGLKGLIQPLKELHPKVHFLEKHNKILGTMEFFKTLFQGYFWKSSEVF